MIVYVFVRGTNTIFGDPHFGTPVFVWILKRANKKTTLFKEPPILGPPPQCCVCVCVCVCVF